MKLDITLADRYQLQKQISKKAGRSTYLAVDNHSQNLVIVKILQFNEFFQWDDLKLFEREANTIKNIAHPNIPQYVDYFEIDDDNFRGFALVQTYIDAPSVETVIKQGRKFSETEIIELTTKILDILTYLHQQNPPVIHRDIKPSNILITNRSGNSIGNIYLVDFGSVQTVAYKDSGTITIVGSYGYIPLEQFGGQTTMVSDLYSLGMTLVYLITGVHPAELQRVNGKVQFNNSNVSDPLAKWLEKITEPYAEKRYQSAIAAKEALQSPGKKSGYSLATKPKNTKITIHRDRNFLLITYPLNEKVENALYPSGLYLLLFLLVFIFLIHTHIIIIAVFILAFSIAFSHFILLIMNALINTIKLKGNHYKHKTILINKNRVIKEGFRQQNNNKVCWKTKMILDDVYFVLCNHEGIQIVAANDEYAIQHNSFTEREYLWLKTEISSFLKIKIEEMSEMPLSDK